MLSNELTQLFRDMELASRETEKARAALAGEVGLGIGPHTWPSLPPSSPKKSYRSALLRSVIDSLDADAGVATAVKTSVDKLELGDDEDIKEVTTAIYNKYKHRWALEDVERALKTEKKERAKGNIPSFELKRCKNHLVYERVVRGLRQIYVTAKTPSDWRAKKNGECRLRRLDEEARERCAKE